jgi:hypothetical protein
LFFVSLGLDDLPVHGESLTTPTPGAGITPDNGHCSATSPEVGNRRQQMSEEDEQVAHGGRALCEMLDRSHSFEGLTRLLREIVHEE